MLVLGTRKNPRDSARDASVKEYLREQVRSETNEARKAFYEALQDATCFADDCDQCSNKRIKFQSTPTFGLDPDVRRYVARYGCYQTISELREKEDAGRKESTNAILSGVHYREGNNDLIRIREQERDGLSGQPGEVSSDQAERIEALLLQPISEEMVT
jgi:hypothetical protein